MATEPSPTKYITNCADVPPELPHPAKRRIYSSLAHGFLWIAAEEYIAAISGKVVQFLQNRYCLGRERHQVSCLGLGYQIAPFGFLKVKARPFRFTQITGAHEQKRGKEQGAADHQRAFEGVQRTQELCHFLGGW